MTGVVPGPDPGTAHRVTPAAGERPRIVAVFSFRDRPGVRFSDEDRIGFFGRAA